VLTPENRDRLQLVSVATLTTCLYRAGFHNVCPRGIGPVARGQPRMVGEAFTLRFIPMREDVGGPSSYAAGQSVHQRAFEECPPGHVLVMDTGGETEGCSCGDLLVGRLQARGVAGVVTDGGFRDTPDIARLRFPAYQLRPVPQPSFARLHAVDLDVPVGCGKVAVYPGDIVVGDQEGVVIIPAKLANAMAEEAFQLTRYDEFAAEQVTNGRSIVGLYPANEAAMAEYAAWRKRRDGA
jgi:regulator of RNase E activity RraA